MYTARARTQTACSLSPFATSAPSLSSHHPTIPTHRRTATAPTRAAPFLLLVFHAPFSFISHLRRLGAHCSRTPPRAAIIIVALRLLASFMYPSLLPRSQRPPAACLPYLLCVTHPRPDQDRFVTAITLLPHHFSAQHRTATRHYSTNQRIVSRLAKIFPVCPKLTHARSTLTSLLFTFPFTLPFSLFTLRRRPTPPCLSQSRPRSLSGK